jgi:hypothetical protein
MGGATARWRCPDMLDSLALAHLLVVMLEEDVLRPSHGNLSGQETSQHYHMGVWFENQAVDGDMDRLNSWREDW